MANAKNNEEKKSTHPQLTPGLRDPEAGNKIFEEWDCVLSGIVGKFVFDKVKLIRPRVKITEFEAHTLNYPYFNSEGNHRIRLYFKPGEDAPFVLTFDEAA